MKTRLHALDVGVNFTQKIVSSVRNVRNNNKTHFCLLSKEFTIFQVPGLNDQTKKVKQKELIKNRMQIFY